MTNDITTTETILPPADRDAVEIGELHRSGIEQFIQAGFRLIEKKKQIERGMWMQWLEDNEDALGFGKLTAQRFMRTAKASLTTLEREEAANKELWHNDKRDRRALLAARLAREEPPDDMPELPERCRLIHASVAAAANSPGAMGVTYMFYVPIWYFRTSERNGSIPVLMVGRVSRPASAGKAKRRRTKEYKMGTYGDTPARRACEPARGTSAWGIPSGVVRNASRRWRADALHPPCQPVTGPSL
jgi:hypothetical protein